MAAAGMEPSWRKPSGMGPPGRGVVGEGPSGTDPPRMDPPEYDLPAPALPASEGQYLVARWPWHDYRRPGRSRQSATAIDDDGASFCHVR